MFRQLPVVAALVPAGRDDGRLVDAGGADRRNELLRLVERHVDVDRPLGLLREVGRLVGNRLRAMRLDADHHRVAHVGEVGELLDPLLDRLDAMRELPGLVSLRHPVVVGVIAFEEMEVDLDVGVEVEEPTHAVEPDAREYLERAVGRRNDEVVVEAVRAHVRPGEAVPPLHAVDGHLLPPPHVRAVRLVEGTVKTAPLDPVAVRPAWRGHERRNNVHPFRVRRQVGPPEREMRRLTCRVSIPLGVQMRTRAVSGQLSARAVATASRLAATSALNIAVPPT